MEIKDLSRAEEAQKLSTMLYHGVAYHISASNTVA